MTNSEKNTHTNDWYRAAIGTAVVAAAAALFIALILTAGYLKTVVVLPEREAELEELRKIAAAQPDNAEVLTLVRELDLRIRQERTRRHDFARRGAILMLAGVALCLASLKCASVIKQKPPHPEPASDQQETQIRHAVLARRAIIAGLLIMGAASAYLVFKPTVNIEDLATGDRPQVPAAPSMEEFYANWPSFRGPDGSGVSTHNNTPTSFDAETGAGILWKTEIPLPGFNSPIVWGDRVFCSGADETALQVYCFDALSGSLLWTADATNVPDRQAQMPEMQEDTGYAASTMVTDGRHACAIFPNGIIAAFDYDGNRLWAKNLGVPDSAYGYASSLAIYRNLVIIQYDQASEEDELSALIAVDIATGETAWQTKRPVPNSWTSPIVAKVADSFRVFTSADPWAIAYDPNNGAELWRYEITANDSAPSPVYSTGYVFAIEPYTTLYALKHDPNDPAAAPQVAWTADDDVPDISSPLSDGSRVYTLTASGHLICYSVADGKLLWEHEFDGDFSASPALADGNIYLLNESGVMYVIAAADEYTEIATSKMKDKFRASPAFANERLFLRGQKHLYCIGKTD